MNLFLMLSALVFGGESTHLVLLGANPQSNLPSYVANNMNSRVGDHSRLECISDASYCSADEVRYQFSDLNEEQLKLSVTFPEVADTVVISGVGPWGSIYQGCRDYSQAINDSNTRESGVLVFADCDYLKEEDESTKYAYLVVTVLKASAIKRQEIATFHADPSTSDGDLDRMMVHLSESLPKEQIYIKTTRVLNKFELVAYTTTDSYKLVRVGGMGGWGGMRGVCERYQSSFRESMLVSSGLELEVTCERAHSENLGGEYSPLFFDLAF